MTRYDPNLKSELAGRNPEALKWIVLKKIAQPHRVDTVMLAFMPG
jgi:hypothetical protein